MGMGMGMGMSGKGLSFIIQSKKKPNIETHYTTNKHYIKQNTVATKTKLT
jgi:hypothetical protein